MDVIHGALVALTTFDDDGRDVSEVVAALVAHPQPRVRAQAVATLAAISPSGPQSAVDLLVRATHDSEGCVRAAALAALNRVVYEAEWLFKAYVEALSDSDPQVIMTTMSIVRDIGERGTFGTSDVERLLTHENAEVRELAAETLLSMGSGRATSIVSLVNMTAAERNSRVLAKAATALWKLSKDPERVMPVLAKLLGECESVWAGVACTIIAEIGDRAREIIPVLVARLQEPTRDWDFLWATMSALRSMGPAAGEVAPTLARFLKHPSDLVAGNAAAALTELGPAALPSLREALTSGQDRAMEYAADALGQLGISTEQVTEELEELLGHAKEEVRGWAAVALAELSQTAETVPHLANSLKSSSDPTLRLRSARALGLLGRAARAALRMLRTATHDADAKVAAEAVRSIELISS